MTEEEMDFREFAIKWFAFEQLREKDGKEGRKDYLRHREWLKKVIYLQTSISIISAVLFSLILWRVW